MILSKLLQFMNLQLFAGEGAGDGGNGDGAVTGVEGADPGHQELLALGVPKDKLPKNVAYRKATAAKTATAEQDDGQKKDEGQSHGAEENTQQEEQGAKRLTWDEIKADPEYKEAFQKEMQSMMRSRLRSAKEAEENLAKLMPALEVLARDRGMDMENIDYGKLADAINQDKSFYEDGAIERGDSVEAYMEKDQQQRTESRDQRAQAKSLRDQLFEEHVNKMYQQGEALKKLFPNFDLNKELQNPAFARMTAPGEGIMSVEDAYRAVHRKEIEAATAQVTAQMTAQQISNAIQSGSHRPQENGTSGRSSSVITFDYAKASREERAKHDAWVRSELAKGRNPRPEDYPG